jgi:hypothetical protein
MEVSEQLSAFDFRVKKKYFLGIFLECSEGGGSKLISNIGYCTPPIRKGLWHFVLLPEYLYSLILLPRKTFYILILLPRIFSTR